MRSAFAGIGISITLASFFAGCASTTRAPVVDRSSVQSSAPASAAAKASAAPAVPLGKDAYVVKKGDTLYSIALDQGLDYKDLVTWNGLENPNLIRVGQALRVSAPETTASATVAIAKPVGVGASVEKRSLDGRSLDGNTDAFKREPKAGKEVYSDEAFARMNKGGEIVAVKAETKPELKPVEPKVETRPDSAGAADSGDEAAWSWPASGKMLAGFSEGKSKGVDIAGKLGDPVLAAADGKVAYIGSGIPSYGQLLIIKHNTTYLTAYAHNSKILVKEGQAVSRGQKVAEMGNTGTDEVKLHFEVRRQGKPVDPTKYLPAR